MAIMKIYANNNCTITSKTKQDNIIYSFSLIYIGFSPNDFAEHLNFEGFIHVFNYVENN